MKLYLSSYYFGNDTKQLAELLPKNRKVAIIMNATDSYGDAKRPYYRDIEIEKFRNLGFTAEELDLREHFVDNAKLDERLGKYGAVWVMGGNSFVLRRALHQSGADKLLIERVKNGTLVYAGFSAGSVVITPTLRGIELVDDPHNIPTYYDSEVIWDGLGIVDFCIVPHYKSDHPESEAIEKVVAYYKNEQIPYKTITDGNAIVINS